MIGNGNDIATFEIVINQITSLMENNDDVCNIIIFNVGIPKTAVQS